jgi:hypothetical protein
MIDKTDKTDNTAKSKLLDQIEKEYYILLGEKIGEVNPRIPQILTQKYSEKLEEKEFIMNSLFKDIHEEFEGISILSGKPNTLESIESIEKYNNFMQEKYPIFINNELTEFQILNKFIVDGMIFNILLSQQEDQDEQDAEKPEED